MFEVIGVLILFAIALALAYKIGTVDGISYTIDLLEEKGLIKFDVKKPTK